MELVKIGNNNKRNNKDAANDRETNILIIEPYNPGNLSYTEALRR